MVGLLSPGYVSFTRVRNADCQFIANCITQKTYGSDGVKYASYKSLLKCLDTVLEVCKINSITDIATPPIGCGLGGLKREIVFELLREFEEENKDYGIEFFVYDLK